MADHDTQDTLKRELDSLTQTRDELRVQMHLAKVEAKEEWKRLETTFERVEWELKRLGNHSKEAVKDIADRARSLIDELKSGYAKVRAELKATHH